MTIAFFSNYLNHHQSPLAEAFNALEGVEYTFVATTGVPEFRKKLGYQEYEKPYMLDVTKSAKNKEKALKLSIDADVAIYLSSGMNEYIIHRLKAKKLTFEYSERWFKKKWKLNLLSPRLWKHQLMYYRYGYKSPLYMLCASAYAAKDYNMLFSYRSRCYKWGYFTRVDNTAGTLKPLETLSPKPTIRLMWCARFIDWKHPELVAGLARNLKADGYKFEIDMYGDGPLRENIEKEVASSGLSDCLHLMGVAPNDQILEQMRQHDIFLFTSDQNEGWGAVANESMSNGCCLVGSDKIGAVPFLVKDCENGMIFNSCNLDSLYEKVKYLLDNPEDLQRMSRNGVATMQNIWSPANATKNFLQLVDDLQHGRKASIKDGPCSES